jgi:fluoroacetyl-CoA thioesterase
MGQIPLGAKGTFTLRVLPEHLANRFKDAILPQVLATPVMVLMMENAALNAIRQYLDPGRDRSRHCDRRTAPRRHPRRS